MTGAGRVVVAAGLAVALVILFGSGLVAFRALEPTPVSTAGGGAGQGCTPEPCINTGPFEIDVARSSSVPSSAAGGQLLRLDITFHNHSNDAVTANGNHERADLIDFSLLDSSGQEHHPDYTAPGCEHWPSYEIPQFQEFGPKPVCFAVGSPGRGPFTLRWNPDLGLLSHPYDLRLP